ncbi:hypothetical protein ACKTEK_10910 [Tepidamorphus sp. 3E244]|uniref:hypothetical protein n=1 Tax=Tepidamorphus sp. 3E244 TaxID=3385498 RepID=UPI0038FD33BB
MRVVQPAGERGSLKWMQRVANSRPALVRLEDGSEIDWVSPKQADDFAEYRDAAFLHKLGLDQLKAQLAAFWPSRGPQWDALGKAGKRVVLVEAKAHLREAMSPPCAAGEVSRRKIEAAFSQVKADLGVTSQVDWCATFYQYTNRLAHLWFLRQHGVNAVLLLVDFINDADMNGPSAASEWSAFWLAADHALGLSKRHALSRYIQHVHPDVRELAEPSTH